MNNQANAESDQTNISPDELREIIELVAELAVKNPDVERQLEESLRHQMLLFGFPADYPNSLEKESMAREDLMYALTRERVRQRVSQAELAARMETKQPAVVLIERGQRDPRLSTIHRYAASLGKRIAWHLVDNELVTEKQSTVNIS
ncbi:MAG TPA: helix-turn-helix domain-containing protein [Ktedonobacteraceae bacterium]|jgi:DNA-binding XRE family transcriptional regulator